MIRSQNRHKSFWYHNRFPLRAALSSSLVTGWASAAQAQTIFNPLKQSMQCIVNAATVGGIAGGSNTTLSQLPALVPAVIGIGCFIGGVVIVSRGWIQSNQGEDTTNVIRAGVGGIIAGVMILLFQNFFLGGSSCSSS